MNPHEKVCATVLGIVAAVCCGLAIAVVLHGCGGSQKSAVAAEVAAACLDEGISEVLTSRSCHEALAALQRVVRTYPECAAVLTPRGSELTAIELGAVTLLCADEPTDAGHE